jgi:hypothetical protein
VPIQNIVTMKSSVLTPRTMQDFGFKSSRSLLTPQDIPKHNRVNKTTMQCNSDLPWGGFESM